MLLSELQNFIKTQTGLEFEEVPDWNGSKLTYGDAIYDGKKSYIDIHIWRNGKISFWVSWKNNYSGRSEFVEDEFDVVDAILKYCEPKETQLSIFDI